MDGTTSHPSAAAAAADQPAAAAKSSSSASASASAAAARLAPQDQEDPEDEMYYLPYDDEYWHKDDRHAHGGGDGGGGSDGGGGGDGGGGISLPDTSSSSSFNLHLNSNNTTTSSSSSSSSSSHSSDVDGRLLEANREVVQSLVPVLVLLALVLLLTVLGNAIVCVVYRSRFRRNSVNLLVVFLAALEIVMVCVAVPMEMAVVALPLMFHSQATCKIMRYVETVSVCVVLLVLTAIAVDRYLKMSRPTIFLSHKWVRSVYAGTVLTALGVALPSLFVFGTKPVPTQVPGLEGTACDVVEDALSVRSSPVHLIYIVLLLVTLASTVITKIVLYVIMFVRICQRKSASRGEKVSPARREYPRKHRFVTEDSVSSCGGGAEENRRLPTTSSSGSSGLGMAASSVRSGRSSPGVDPARVPLKSGMTESARIGQGLNTAVDVQSHRMTWILFLASVVTVVTLLPFVALRALLVMTDLLDHLGGSQPVHLAYQLCLRLYLLHAPLLPLLYFCCNHNLRRETRHLLQNACLACKRTTPRPSSSSASSSNGATGGASSSSHR